MNVYYANDTAEEYCTLPDPTQPQQLAIVGYLLFEGPLDGTSFTAHPDPEEISEAIDEKIQRERESERRIFWRYYDDPSDYDIERFHDTMNIPVDDYDIEEDIMGWWREYCANRAESNYWEDGEWDRASMSRVAAAGLTFDEYFEYLGRWHDGEVRLVLDAQAVANYTDITNDVVHEMHDTVPDRFLADGEELLTPDFVVASGDDGGGGGDEDEASSGGDNERTLFPSN